MEQIQHFAVRESVRYPEDFKRNIVSRICAGESINKLSKEYQMPRITLERWTKAYSLPVGGNTPHTEAKDHDRIVIKNQENEIKSLTQRLAQYENEIKSMNNYVRKLERTIIVRVLQETPVASSEIVNGHAQ